ncbi:MAG: hypothetical protein JRI23_04025 [Deltaproteobacteria bacterium]|nr:hypothetical protein [Deltaproteobacteria bacterium]
MRWATLGWFSVAACLLAAVSCDDDETSREGISHDGCKPGISRVCLGPDQCNGVQYCEGTYWYPCECGRGGAGGNSGGSDGQGGS